MAATQTPPPAPGGKAPKRGKAGKPRGDSSPPKPAEGIELLGEYEGSGFKEAPFIARRADGQTIQLSRLLHVVAEAADGKRGYPEMADVVGEEIDRNVSADNVRFLVERKLRPMGVLAESDGTSPELEKPDQLLALKFRTAVIPEGVTKALTTVFRPLFFPPVLLVIVPAFLAFAVWLFFIHGVSQPLRAALYNPALLLAMFVGVVVATAFHEVGHASALRYGGGRPGVMGAGIYVVWPAFFTDVTDAYRLSKIGRLRTDIGGIYFNAIIGLLVWLAYTLTSYEPVLLLGIVQVFAILQQLMPLLRLDGYYIISDLTGVPDMLTRIKPVLTGLVPGKEPSDKVTALKPWARRVVTTYVIILVPVLLLAFVLMLMQAPRAMATAYDSFGVQVDKLGKADGALTGAASVLQMVMLTLPILGIVLTTSRVGGRAAKGALNMTADRPLWRGGTVAAGVGAAVLMAFTWWPNGEYRPVQPGEKGTVQAAVKSIPEIPTGRPALPVERERALGGAPTERERLKRDPDAEIRKSTTNPSAADDPARTSTRERQAQRSREADRRREDRARDAQRRRQSTGTTPAPAATTPGQPTTPQEAPQQTAPQQQPVPEPAPEQPAPQQPAPQQQAPAPEPTQQQPPPSDPSTPTP